MSQCSLCVRESGNSAVQGIKRQVTGGVCLLANIGGGDFHKRQYVQQSKIGQLKQLSRNSAFKFVVVEGPRSQLF